MPAVSKLLQLPEDVRRELYQRLVESAFSDFAGHAAWLTEKGHPIRRTALFDFAIKHREAIVAEVSLSAAQVAAHASTVSAQRIECLKVAANVRLGGVDLEEVVSDAEKLLSWARR